MKKILFLAVCAGLVMACGGRGNSNKEQSVHVHTEECDHDHSGHDHDAGHTHTHADGTVCDHDHGDGHDHSGHSHGETHLHEDGTVCDHDHGGDHAGHDHSDNNHSHGEDCDHDHGDHDPDEIIFTAEQASRTDFEVSIVRPGTFREVIKTSGKIMAAQGDEVTVAATSSGIVKFAGASLADGSRVGSGTPLFYISSKNIASGDILALNEAAFRKAQADLERAEKLLADRIVSQREYDETRLAFEQAKAGYDALAGAGSSSGVRVTSPISGYVVGLGVAEGDYVETGQALATVSQNRTLQLRADVSQRYLPRLSNISGANFTVPYEDRTYQLADNGGKLLSVGRTAVSSTALIPVTFSFNNTGTVLPGTIVEVSLLGLAEHNVTAIPLTAVTEEQGLYYVYVQTGSEVYMRREVKTGPDDGVRIKILSGLEPGERVVTRGAVNVKMASASGAIPHSHEH